MSEVKFRAKLGGLEFEYEGEDGFLKTEASLLLDKIVAAFTSLPTLKAVTGLVNEPASSATPGSNGDFEHTTNTIASLSGSKSGPDLAMAAAAHLALVKGQDKFARKAILDEMQSATTFYNQNFSGNLSKMLVGLTKSKRLNLVGTHTYALTKTERDAYEALLAQSS